MYNFTIGTDPEFFIEKDNKIISAEGVIKGSKWNPIKFDDDGYFMLEDNVMVEFNTPPVSDKQNWIDSVEFAKEWLTAYLAIHDITPNFQQVSHKFTNAQLNTPQAQEFGCQPDFNVHEKAVNKVCAENNWRSCGGHIHIGFDYSVQEEQELLIKCLDLTLGLHSAINDDDVVRKNTYGKAGSCRFKEYGVEYRTPSNYWLANPELIGAVYDQVSKAFEIYSNFVEFESLMPKVRNVIDTGNKKEAINLVAQINQLLKIKV